MSSQTAAIASAARVLIRDAEWIVKRVDRTGTGVFLSATTSARPSQTQVYESVKPPSGNGKLLWHALGAKTVELINENIHVESVRDDVETR